MGCPSDEALAELVDGSAPAARRAELEAHLDTCASCRRLVSALASAGAPASSLPARLGRYAIVEELGAGAMGVVYRARDPELDREVALKVLHDGDDGARLRREAQALARLAHPHTVAVYEVGTADGVDYVAMELVRGPTLRAYLAGGPRPWAELAPMFAGLARGLAAAHAAGLVHRDIKPENILVGDDGRVRLGDFGLADEAAVPVLGEAAPSDPLRTSTGALVGTPAYMSPELLAGAQPATAASDVFALVVCLYEALEGRRPFPAATLRELRVMLAAGAAPARRSPRAAARILARGLAVDPARRYRDAEELARALDGARRRTSPLVVGAALVAVAAGGIAVGRAGGSPAWRGPCDEGDAAIEQAWPAAPPGRLATEPARAVREALGGYARRWRAVHVRVCRDPAADPARACLAAAALQLETVVTELATSERAEVRARGLELVAELPAVEACAAPELRERPPLPADPAARAAALVAEPALAQAQLALTLGRPDDAAARLADAERAGAGVVGDVALRARWRLVRAHLAARRGAGGSPRRSRPTASPPRPRPTRGTITCSRARGSGSSRRRRSTGSAARRRSRSRRRASRSGARGSIR